MPFEVKVNERRASAPNIVNTFLESGDFAGKNIVLFATSGGSGFGETLKCLRPSAPGANIVAGELLNGCTAAKAQKFVKKHL